MHRFNTLVKKGEYRFENLPKIYCIGILAKTIFLEIADYHNIAILRNAQNETIDDQLTFITVELDKFLKRVKEVESDLDKLIYTMKNLHTITEASQFPKFWNEEWLKRAILEVDLRNMTPEQKLAYEMTLSANALAVKNENKKIDAVKESFVVSLIEQTDFDDEKIADLSSTSIEFVTRVRKKLSADK